MSAMTIAKLARSAGVGVQTVRYYQRRGLMPVPRTGSDSAYRHYNEEDARQLRFIRRAQTAGFTLEEIKELLSLDRASDRSRVRALAQGRLDELACRLHELEASRTALERLLHTCRHSGNGPCPIIAAFEEPAALRSGDLGTRRVESHSG